MTRLSNITSGSATVLSDDGHVIGQVERRTSAVRNDFDADDSMAGHYDTGIGRISIENYAAITTWFYCAGSRWNRTEQVGGFRTRQEAVAALVSAEDAATARLAASGW